MEDTCDILNRIFTKGKDVETMMEKLKDFKEEQKLNQGIIKDAFSYRRRYNMKYFLMHCK